MLKTAICDDDIEWINEIEKNVRAFEKDIDISIYSCAKTLMNNLMEGEKFDVIFLDIEFPDGRLGVDVGNFIRNNLRDMDTQIIYVSAVRDNIMSLFDSRPLNLLPKPIDGEKLSRVLKTAHELTDRNERYFHYKAGGSVYRIKYNEIRYFESMSRKIKIAGNGRDYEFYGNITDIEEKLDGSNFVKIQRSYIINLNYVKEYHSSYVIMENETRISVSRSYKERVREAVFKNFNDN
ncbi:MAG: LytTR family DNA-binding domain-containing protein [Clostridia bacterium]|nr:LytTR family DNA-binding domain-containing protein [Clostridia bacterium]